MPENVIYNELLKRAHATLGASAMLYGEEGYAEDINPLALSPCTEVPKPNEPFSFIWKVGVLFLAYPPPKVSLDDAIVDDNFPMYIFVAQQEEPNDPVQHLGYFCWETGGGADPFFSLPRAQGCFESCLSQFTALKSMGRSE